MATQTNLEILEFLLQGFSSVPFLCIESEEEANKINALPPLNEWCPKNGPRKFLFDTDESIICYVDPKNPIFETPEYQVLLSRKPILDVLGIQVYSANPCLL